tara:strand:- start:317 stop:682 length:366 start_codon:yes stop_codon:yes gene_type:complete
MNNRIVRIRKLDDISDRDWEITLENEGKIVHNHKHFFEIVERGMANEPPKPTVEKPVVENVTYQEILFPTEEEKFEEEKKKEEELKKKEKEEVNAFRKDVKELSYYQWKKKYVKEMGNTNK